MVHFDTPEGATPIEDASGLLVRESSLMQP